MAFCCRDFRPLREVAANSKLVVWGTVLPSREKPDKHSDLLITHVLRDHPLRGNRLELKLGEHEPLANPNNPPDYLVFFAVLEGELYPIREIEAGPAVVRYLQGMLALDTRDEVTRLRYCMGFLDHPDSTIAYDAFNELELPGEEELIKKAGTFPVAKLRALLRNPRSPAYRLRLYGMLLGACGNRGDVALLRAVMAREASAGLLIGWTLLDPTGGWAHIRKLLEQPSGDFLHRHAALKAACFFQEKRPEVIGKKRFQEALGLALAQGDFADLVIQALRHCCCWDLTGRILVLDGKRSHASEMMRRALFCYAIQCPLPEAAAFLEKHRKSEGKLIAELIELLQLD
jgi:hypothetical protein